MIKIDESLFSPILTFKTRRYWHHLIMKPLIVKENNDIHVKFSLEELIIINNSLSEVCYGIDMDDNEFSTRLGAEHEDAVSLLNNFSTLIKKIQNRAIPIAS